MLRLHAVLLILCIAPFVSAAPIPVENPKPLKELPFPGNVSVIAQLNGIDRTKARLANILLAFGAKDAKAYGDKLEEKWKELLEDRDLKGIDTTGRIYQIVGDTKNNGGEIPTAMMLPVPDFKTFRDKFLTAEERKTYEKGKNGYDEVEFKGSTTYLVPQDKYVVLTPSKEMAESFAMKFEPFAVEKMGGLAATFLDSDASVYVNIEKLVTDHRDDLNAAKMFIPQLLQAGAMGIDKRQAEMLMTMIEGLFRVSEDSKALALGLEFRPTGANLRIEMRFKGDSQTSLLFADEKPGSLKVLGELPKGMKAYSASRFGKKLSSSFQVFSQAVSAGDDDEKTAAAIEKYQELLAAAEGDSRNASGEGTSTLQAFTTPDADKLHEAMLKIYKNLDAGGRYGNIVVKKAPKVTAKAQTHAGFTFAEAAIELDFDASVANIPQEELREAAIASMKKLAPEKQSLWIGTDGKTFLQLTGKDWAEAKKLLDAFVEKKDRLADDAAFAATRKELPENASYLMVMEANSLMGQIGEYMGTMAGAIPGFPGGQLPKFGKTSGAKAYLGIGITAKPEVVRFDLFVPAAAMVILRDAVADADKEKD